MTTLRLSLRAGERIFVNGAVMRVDRKTSLELLNDVTFLLESHVMQADDAKTPIRQLYFLVQMMLIDPADAAAARDAFDKTYPLLLAAFSSSRIRDGLMDAADLVERDRAFDALKCLRGLIPIEDAILSAVTPAAVEPRTLETPLAMGARS
ncbi:MULTISPECIES: flagellar biosynthesis repressor FlbT [unclassified Aureimonas]|jgi:flagellar protein FlbT|uniref:flagellar biosynthesis repressor FlbT n=1 Tax=unclassified Aureimonas TaxID=2615206 RepID=UPI0006FD24A0|nr:MULTISPECIES: flagellar biosynthesis repressor FlbT [unclassified Aureimonas]KQT66088.1 flagellum biosynthesis protein FlbT [Aureimonas sp. Leaf427]KQT81048.1 flagellum biosynthesis protein FlbT [Aureimonas sp. Leaf460]